MGRQIYIDELTHQLVLDNGESIDNITVDDIHIDFPELSKVYTMGSPHPRSVQMHPPVPEVRINALLIGEYRASQKIPKSQLSPEPLEKVKLRRIKDDKS